MNHSSLQRHMVFAGFCVLVAIFAVGASAYVRDMPYRIVWEKGKDLNAQIERLKIAGKAGYNGVVYGGTELGVLEKQGPSFFTRFAKLAAEAKRQKITIIPGHFSAWSGADHDRMLAEASPVRGTPFKVVGNTAKCASDHTVALNNGGFESFNLNSPNNWKLKTIAPGKNCFQDKATKHSGLSSIRLDNLKGYASLSQTVPVKSYRAYRISAWFKTSISDERNIGFMVAGKNKLIGRRWRPFAIPKDAGFYKSNFAKQMDWRQCSMDFNSMDETSVTISFGYNMARYGYTGSLWIDDLKVEEVGLYETIRRKNHPIVVKSADGSKVFMEGKDYVVDPKCSKLTEDDFGYEGHLKIPAGSSIQSGQTLKVDWYKFNDANLYHSSTNFCLPEAWAALEDNVRRMDELHKHKKCFMVMYDEWRSAFYDDRCELFPKAKTAGDYMAATMARTGLALRKHNSLRNIILESDMYDPYHNAHSNYHMCRGGTANSWKNLDTSIIIMNWNAKNMSQSIGFFMGVDPMNKGRANPQLLYAQGSTEANQKMNTVLALEKKHNVKAKIAGMMWTTWSNRFEHIPITAAAFKAKGWWGDGPLPDPGVAIKDVPSRPVRKKVSHLSIRNGSETCVIEFSLSYESRVDVRVVDANGRTVKSFAIQEGKAGLNRVKWNTKRIPSGVYFFRLLTEGKEFQQVRQVVM